MTTRLSWLEAPLRDALGMARHHHALLIHGPAGVGQFELALLLAQAWLCSAGTQRPCGACADCRLVEARTHPDLRVLIPPALHSQACASNSASSNWPTPAGPWISSAW